VGTPHGEVDIATGDERLRTFVRRIRLIPDELRRFTVSTKRALAEYGVPRALLAEFDELGLPGEGERGARRYDHHDLMSLSLDFGLRSAWTFGMRWWEPALEYPGPLRHCLVKYDFSCPDPGHEAPCHVEVLAPDRTWRAEDVRADRAVTTLAATTEFRLRNTWPELPPDVLELAEEIGRLEFKSLPIGLGFDLDFVRETGLVDCAGAAYLLYKRAQEAGLPVRFSMGLVVTLPYASPHCWAEFEVDGDWVPVDPLMVNALINWGLLSGEQWSAGRSIGGILGRLAGRAGPLARHNGESVMQLTMPTSYVEEPAGEP
jgi:hypothetical protein